MSEVTITVQSAQGQIRTAAQSWNAAIRGMRSYPDRLALLADAADDQRRALTAASVVDLPWPPQQGARNLGAPFELAPENRPDAPAALWARFDRTLKRLGALLEGDSALALAHGFGELADVLHDLVAAVDRPDDLEDVRQAG